MINFLKKLRESNETIKMRWLILFSGISMVIIVFLWINYFNLMVVAPIGLPQQAGQDEQRTQGAGQGFSFWQTFKSGLGVISGSIAGATHSLFGALTQFTQPKSYEVKP